jgi:hypothetical protein
MMTTPRVTEIPLAMAAVEPDSFMDTFGASVPERRLAGPEAGERRQRPAETRSAAMHHSRTAGWDVSLGRAAAPP